MMKSFLLIYSLLLSTFVAAQSPQKASAPPKEQTASADYVIGLEDTLSINVWKEPELSVRDVMVRLDGKISLPLIGEMQANGLTPKQLQDRLTERLKDFVATPNVTVVVTKITSQSVSIVGQVAKPGVYPLSSPLTVLELLALAGGFRQEAKIKKISIVRKESGRTSYFPFNYKDVSAGHNLQQNIGLKPGDIIIVP